MFSPIQKGRWAEVEEFVEISFPIQPEFFPSIPKTELDSV